MVYLLDAQERCFDIFTQFAPAKALIAWGQPTDSRLCAELKTLCQVGRKANEVQRIERGRHEPSTQSLAL